MPDATSPEEHIAPDALRSVTFFKSFTAEELELVAEIMDLVRLEKGVPFLREGEKGDAMFILVEGAVAVVHRDEAGREHELARIGKGEFFGEVAFIDEKERSADIVPTEPGSALRISHSEISAMTISRPSMALKFFVAVGLLLASRTREANRKYLEASAKSRAQATPSPRG